MPAKPDSLHVLNLIKYFTEMERNMPLSGIISKKIHWFIVLISFAAITTTASAKIVFYNGFEKNGIGGNPASEGFYYQAFKNCNRIYSYSSDADNRIVKNIARVGSQANAQTVHYNCDYRSLNGDTLQKPRQSLAVPPENHSIVVGKEHWIAFSFMLPENWVSDTYWNKDSLLQLHNEDTKWGFKPFKNGKNVVHIEESNNEFELSISDQFDSNGNLIKGKEVKFHWPTVRNEWQDVVIHFLPCRIDTPNCKGILDIYIGNKDRRAKGIHTKPVYSHRGLNTSSQWHKVTLNLYKWQWVCTSQYQGNFKACYDNAAKTNSKASRTVYFDELAIGDSQSSLNEVAPYFGDCEDCGYVEQVLPSPPKNLYIN